MQRNNQNTQLSLSDILSLDPLVSDSACQNRAVFLVDIARKILTNEALDVTESQMIQACQILTRTKSFTRSVAGYIDKEVTEVDALPVDDYFTSKSQELQLERKNQINKKRKIVAHLKQFLADTTIQYLQKKTKVGLSMEYQLYQDPNSLAYFKLEDYSIPILPIYLSAKMMMQYVARNNVPFQVNFKRVQADEASETCIGQASFCYRSFGKDEFIETTLSEIEPVIVADVYSFKGSKYSSDSIFLTEESFDECVVSLKNLGVVALMLLAACAHTPYSKLTKTKSTNDPMFNIAEVEGSVDAVPVDLNQCSQAEFMQLRSRAKGLGFFDRRVSIDHVYSALSHRTTNNHGA